MTGLEDPKQLHPSPAISQAMRLCCHFRFFQALDWLNGEKVFNATFLAVFFENFGTSKLNKAIHGGTAPKSHSAKKGRRTFLFKQILRESMVGDHELEPIHPSY